MKKITQIVACYNEENYIEDCINSLLNQTYNNLEIIVVSDGSTDNTVEIVKSISDERVLLIDNKENRGQAFCRNQALDIATGEYVGFFDGDDISCLNRVEVLASYLDEHEEIFGVSCKYDVINENGMQTGVYEGSVIRGINNIRANFLVGCPVGCSCALFRRELTERYNIRQNEKYRSSQDYHYWLQCLQYGDFDNVDEVLFHYRIYDSHTKQIIRSDKSKYDEWMREIFKFAWESRGFDLKQRDLEFIYYYLYECHMIWSVKGIISSIVFKRKIISQMNIMELDENEEIKRVIEDRFFTLIPYLYPIKLIRNLKEMVGKRY